MYTRFFLYVTLFTFSSLLARCRDGMKKMCAWTAYNDTVPHITCLTLRKSLHPETLDIISLCLVIALVSLPFNVTA